LQLLPLHSPLSLHFSPLVLKKTTTQQSNPLFFFPPPFFFCYILLRFFLVSYGPKLSFSEVPFVFMHPSYALSPYNVPLFYALPEKEFRSYFSWLTFSAFWFFLNTFFFFFFSSTFFLFLLLVNLTPIYVRSFCALMMVNMEPPVLSLLFWILLFSFVPIFCLTPPIPL